MRALQIAVLIICIELSISFFANIGLFTTVFYTPAQEQIGAGTGFMSGNINETSNLLGSQKTGTVDTFTAGIGMLIGSIGILINLLGSVVFFLPHLVSVFQFPLLLAIPVQVMIYIIYSVGILQFMSGRSTRLFE
jgi:hypothetical protein